MTQIDWGRTAGNAVMSGSIACALTLAAAAACGSIRNGRPLAPINAISHILWGDEAADVPRADTRHTLTAVALNQGASILWAALYEGAFGRSAERGQVATAWLGAGAVAALAYLVDYHIVPRRLTPGWEKQLPGRGLAVIYAALALGLPARGLLSRAPGSGGERR
jgi:hypothetical protein